MKHRFLETLADEVDASPGGMVHTTVILPTKRAGTHLRKILAGRGDKARILPRITTINRWISEVAGLETADSLKTLFTAYEAYRDAMGKEAQPLEQFIGWAPVMLADFNDVDAALLPTDRLFRDLVDHTEIEHFSFLDAPLSQSQENYRKFWNSLPSIHEALVKRLTQEELAYPGLMAKIATQRIARFLEENPRPYFIFGGLNALTNAEEFLITQVERSERGRIYFEADDHYLERGDHHAGSFLRKHAQKGLGRMVRTESPLHERAFEVHIHAANHRLDQANAVAALLRDNTWPAEDTAVILADESLVVPILQRLPESMEAVNVTMGLPLTETAFYHWLESWFALHAITLVKPGEEPTFPRRELLEFLENPFSHLLWSKSATDLPIKTYIRASDLTADHPLLESALQPMETEGETDFETMLKTLGGIFTFCVDDPYGKLELRAGALGAKRCMEILTRIEKYPHAKNMGIKALGSIVKRAVSGASLSLVGEPLEGLQIMGLLEARSLSFPRVILCSAEENAIPRNPKHDSFIPYDIRLAHGLPGRTERESIYAYQFYRLLQNAERFDAVYQTDIQGLSVGEKSRYLQQVEYDLAVRNKHITVKHHITRPTIAEGRPPESVLDKSPEVLEGIRKTIIDNGLSASSVIRYLESPMEWYFTHVLRLTEPDGEELSAATFGTIVHETLNALYKPCEGRLITEADVEAMLRQLEAVLLEMCVTWAPHRDFNRGLDHVNYRTALGMLTRFLESEKRTVSEGKEEIRYIRGEEELYRNLSVEVDGDTISVPFKGSIDRQDEREGVLHIVDYKTGSVVSSDLTCKEFDRESLSSKPKAVQLMMYEWLCEEVFPGREVRSGIISLPKVGDGLLILKIDDVDKLRLFEDFLREVIREMLDPHVPLIAPPEFKYSIFTKYPV